MNATQAARITFSVLTAFFAIAFALSASAQVPGGATKPGAPRNVVATLVNGQISVAFAAPSSDGGAPIVEYRAFCTAPNLARTPSIPGTSPITVTGLAPNAAYTCFAIATNAAGQSPTSGPSNVVTLGTVAAASTASTVPATKPGAPRNIVATPGPGSGVISVAFAAPSSDGGAPIVEYRASCTAPNVARTPSIAGTSAIKVTGLSPNVPYTCYVTAANGAGQGPTSGPSNVVTLACVPSAPTNVVATPGNAQVTVSFTPPAISCGPVTSYRAVCGTAASGGAAGASAAVGASSPVIVRNLVAGARYVCQVSAMTAAGVGPASNWSMP